MEELISQSLQKITAKKNSLSKETPEDTPSSTFFKVYAKLSPKIKNIKKLKGSEKKDAEGLLIELNTTMKKLARRLGATEKK